MTWLSSEASLILSRSIDLSPASPSNFEVSLARSDTTSLIDSDFEKYFLICASMMVPSATTASTLNPINSRRSSTARKLSGLFIAIFNRFETGLNSIGMMSYVLMFSVGITERRSSGMSNRVRSTYWSPACPANASATSWDTESRTAAERAPWVANGMVVRTRSRQDGRALDATT